MVYSRVVEGVALTFGVSGLLYKSNVLLYDHQSESLWSQMMEKAIAGPLAGKSLRKIPSLRTTWKTWLKERPHTMVLSTDTGYPRNYAIDPYKGYYRGLGVWFPVGKVRSDLSPKEMVMGLEIAGHTKAYPLSVLRKKKGLLTDKVGGVDVQIEISPEGEIRKILDGSGKDIPAIYSYWFGWQAFHPDTEVFTGE